MHGARGGAAGQFGVRTRMILVLLVSLALLMPTELRAQGRGRVPGAPRIPSVPDGVNLANVSRPTGPVHAVIELNDEPAVITARRAGGPLGLSASASRLQVARIDRAQQSVMAQLQGRGVNARVLYRTQKAFNGVAVVVDAAQLDRIKAEPGVRDVRLLPLLDRDNRSAVPLIGAPAAWQSLGLTGAGRKIGIIDSGIDYIHRNFGGSGNYGANTSTTAIGDSPDFPGAIVVGGVDLAGNNYHAGSPDPAKYTPSPDADPIDCPSAQGGGHGTHVAGSAAGRGVNADGSTFAGPYNASVPVESMKIAPGVAPAASLYAIKVFGCTGSTALVARALEWALDPDDDDDLSDHLDVVNVSIGSPFGLPDDPDSVAADNAALAGMVVVISAGNAGDTTGNVGGPGTALRAVTVGASVDGTSKLDQFEALSPVSIAGTYAAAASAAFNWAGMSAAVTRQLVRPSADARSGCDPFAGADVSLLNDRIVLLDWVPDGETDPPCPSAERVTNAATAGARGVVLAYNLAFIDISIGGAPAIPAVITTSTTGDLLKANLGSNVQVKLDKALLNAATVTDPTQVDRIGTFTSRGPSPHWGLLKPDLVAPGVTIFSADSGTGTEGRSQNGTSMAAPIVAGMMVLLKQHHPTWTVEELKALAMNTANHSIFVNPNQTGTVFPTARVGAGRVDASAATLSQSVAYVQDDPGAVGISFGLTEATGGSNAVDRTVVIANKSGASLTYNLGYTSILAVPGTSISFPDGASVSVPAGETRTRKVRLNLVAASLRNPRDPTMSEDQVGLPRDYLAEVSGLVTVTPESGGGPALRVPLHAAVRPTSSMHATQSTIVATQPTQQLSVQLAGTGVDTGENYPTDLTSVVSLFELQAVSPAMPGDASPEDKAADLRYVGVSSDGRIRNGNSDSTIWFGVALEQPWLLPSEEVEVSILIDTDRNGSSDFEVFNTRFVNGLDDPTDVFVSAVYDVAEESTTAPFFLNGFSANTPTALFGNTVMVLPVQVSDLGLTPATPRFNYRVRTWYAGVVRDTTPVLTYDWVRPGVDVFASGVGTPYWYDLPSTVTPIAYNLPNLVQNGSQGLLLLHHFNAAGQRVDTIAVLQQQTIQFAANTPTSKKFGDPPFAVSATASSGLGVTIASTTTGICTVNGANVVTLASSGTCTLRATQAGNSTYAPATTDHTITVAPNPCLPTRPRVAVHSSRLPDGRLQVILEAGQGQIQTIRFGTGARPMVNGIVTIDPGTGPLQFSVPSIVTLTPPVAAKSFTIARINPAGAMTIPMIVTDGCGGWETFVGMGSGV